MRKLITACPAASGRRKRRGNRRKACPWQVWEGARDVSSRGHGCSSVCWTLPGTTGALLAIYSLCRPPYCQLQWATYCIEKNSLALWVMFQKLMESVCQHINVSKTFLFGHHQDNVWFEKSCLLPHSTGKSSIMYCIYYYVKVKVSQFVCSHCTCMLHRPIQISLVIDKWSRLIWKLEDGLCSNNANKAGEAAHLIVCAALWDEISSPTHPAATAWQTWPPYFLSPWHFHTLCFNCVRAWSWPTEISAIRNVPDYPMSPVREQLICPQGKNWLITYSVWPALLLLSNITSIQIVTGEAEHLGRHWRRWSLFPCVVSIPFILFWVCTPLHYYSYYIHFIRAEVAGFAMHVF